VLARAPSVALIDLVQILVVDHDHEASKALVRLLAARGYRTCGVETDPARAIALARTAHIALIALSPYSKFDAIAIARALLEECTVAVLYVVEQLDTMLLMQARETHPSGFIFQPYSAEALYGAIEVTRPLRVSEPLTSYTRELNEDGQLTPREREIFESMLRGMRPPAIARALFISVHTVRRHAQAVFRKLDVHSQIELMNRYGGGPRHKAKM
jgi:DNA-binding NarL/FixJ family response regulator